MYVECFVYMGIRTCFRNASMLTECEHVSPIREHASEYKHAEVTYGSAGAPPHHGDTRIPDVRIPDVRIL